jgi:hypothetical protein
MTGAAFSSHPISSHPTPLQARELMMKGCELCPSNEDVWLEAARLQVGGWAAPRPQVQPWRQLNI